MNGFAQSALRAYDIVHEVQGRTLRGLGVHLYDAYRMGRTRDARKRMMAIEAMEISLNRIDELIEELGKARAIIEKEMSRAR